MDLLRNGFGVTRFSLSRRELHHQNLEGFEFQGHGLSSGGLLDRRGCIGVGPFHIVGLRGGLGEFKGSLDVQCVVGLLVRGVSQVGLTEISGAPSIMAESVR